jgi:hypothetical protein
MDKNGSFTIKTNNLKLSCIPYNENNHKDNNVVSNMRQWICKEVEVYSTDITDDDKRRRRSIFN